VTRCVAANVEDVIIPDCGHWITEEQPQATTKLVVDFLHRDRCMYAERAHSHKAEAEGPSHALYISHPKEVAALIEEAAD
jgi:hypothetical protein